MQDARADLLESVLTPLQIEAFMEQLIGQALMGLFRQIGI